MQFKHFLGLNALDAILTFYALEYLGKYELNPIYRLAYSEIGLIYGLIVIKFFVLIIMYGLIQKIRTDVKIKGMDGRQIGINIICIMFIFVVANNIYWVTR